MGRLSAPAATRAQEAGRAQEHSDHTTALIEEETRAEVLRAYRRAKDLLEHNRGLLRQVADTLLEARRTVRPLPTLSLCACVAPSPCA